MRNFRKLPVPVQTAHGYPCARVPTGGSFLNPQTLRRPLTRRRYPRRTAVPRTSQKLHSCGASAHGLMRIFPVISARKGADERKVGFFSKHRNAAEVHAELSETARSDTDCPLLFLRTCSNRRKFLNPQTPRRPLTPPPLSVPNRSSKNIAEPAQLRSFRASPLRSLFEAYCRTA